MANATGKVPADSTAAGGRQRSAASSTADPAALAAEIEKTREDLAGTLDAIADRVSPKRVARRTSKKVAASVKESAAAAKESVVEGAAAAKEAVRDLTGKASLSATPAVGSSPDLATVALPMADLPPVGAVVLPDLTPIPPAPGPLLGALPDLAPIPPAPGPLLGALPDRAPAVSAYGSAGWQVNKEYLVGTALVLGLLVLLMRRRSR